MKVIKQIFILETSKVKIYENSWVKKISFLWLIIIVSTSQTEDEGFDARGASQKLTTMVYNVSSKTSQATSLEKSFALDIGVMHLNRLYRMLLLAWTTF